MSLTMFRALFLQHFRKIYHTNGNEAAITLSADLKTEELFCQSHGSLKTIWRYHRSTVPLWNMVRLLMVSWACLNFLRKFLLDYSKLVLSHDEKSHTIKTPKNMISSLSTAWLLIQRGVCSDFDLLDSVIISLGLSTFMFTTPSLQYLPTNPTGKIGTW